MPPPILVLVAARSRNGVIGRAGGDAWHIPSDLALFKRLTVGKPVIMGRKTWLSLHVRPLPGRINIVLSRDGSFEPKRALVCERFDEAVQIAKEHAAEDDVEEYCAIGGTAVFEAALLKARRIYLSEIEATVQGDAFFPPLDESEWVEISRESHPAGPDDEFPFTFRVLERR